MKRLLTLLTAAAIALAACGGGAAPTAQAPTATQAPATTTAPTTATAAAAATAPGPNIADALKNGKATYKATYSWTVTVGGQTTTSEQTWYSKGANTRFDFSAGPGAAVSMYSIPDGTFICTSAGGTAFCQKAAIEQAFAQNPAAAFAVQLQSDPTKFNAAFTGGQTIAGQQAQCYSVKSIAGGAFGDVNTCYSSGGVPLKTTISASGTTMTTEATAFSTTVSDSDFVLPAAAR